MTIIEWDGKRPDETEESIEIPMLSEDFGDPETLLNSRDWLQSSLEAKGATFEGGGIGQGRADIDIELEGCRYNVSIRPLTP